MKLLSNKEYHKTIRTINEANDLIKKLQSNNELLKEQLNQGQELPIQIVREPLLSRDKFIELAKIVEIHMQKCPEYRYMIKSGGFTERFNNAYRKYLDKNAR